MNLNRTLLFLLVVTIFTNNIFAGKIVYPWRATTAIVKAGETFEVWFNADAGQTINGIEMQSQYLNVTSTISNTVNLTWVYDQWSGNTCNVKLTVSVPANTPTDRYNLVLKTSSGNETSLAAVKVIKDYKTSFYVFHISDAHRWQGSYDALAISKNVAATIDIANIINPEMVFETGDNHYPNTNSPASTNQRTNDYYNGFMNGTESVNGLNNFSAPVFSIPGNHDTPQKNYELEPGFPAAGYTKVPSVAWNEYYGLQAHNFSYGNARFIGLNNAWFSDEATGVPNFAHQTDEAKAWLNTVGKGTFRIGYCHVMTPTPLKAFYDPLYKTGAPLNLILAGHCHWAGNTHSIKDYPNIKITHSTYPLREVSRKAPFNLYKVDLVANKYTAIGDSIGAQEGVSTASDFSSVKLKLTYSKANDGSNSDNTATIVNKFNFPITGARVRFVVPKGSPYYLKNATINQEFDGTNFHIIDATYDLEANSTYVVSLFKGIQVDECPNDPNKMDPGICGCGVPEGSCPIAATAITVNASVARLVLNTTRQLKVTISPTNTTNKIVNWVSSNPAVATINSEGVVNALSVGNTTITASTYDASKVATASITVLPPTNNYQAEDAEYVGPVEVANQPGYNGTGFLDYTNASNDYIKWNVYVPADGTYILTFRYALTANRPMKLSINDIMRVASVSFPITGAWSTWSTYSTSQTLVEGANSIMLTAIGSSGGNFDELTISGNGISGLKNVSSDADGKSVRIYPNPLHTNKLSIDMVGFENSNNVEVKIINLLGQTVYHKNTKNTAHLDIDTLNLLSKSVYTVSVEAGSAKILNKLILD
jgi:hypothetical protein